MEKQLRSIVGVTALVLLLVAGICLPGISSAAVADKAKTQAVEKTVPQNDENAIARRELADAKAALAEYGKQFSESTELADIKKSISDLDAALKAKQKELAAILEQKMDKDPAYIELSAKKKEYDSIVANIAAKRAEAEKDAKVKALRKEAAELKAKSNTKIKEAATVIEAKLKSDPVVKALAQRKEALATAPRDVTNFKNTILNEPSVKAIRDQIQESTAALSEKKADLREIVVEKMQADPKYNELNDKVRMLTEKATGKKMPPVEGMGAGMAAAGAKAPAIDPATEKKLAEELSSLISLYEKNKIELEDAIRKIKSILSQLPPDSQLYKNTKNALSKIGAPKAK